MDVRCAGSILFCSGTNFRTSTRWSGSLGTKGCISRAGYQHLLTDVHTLTAATIRQWHTPVESDRQRAAVLAAKVVFQRSTTSRSPGTKDRTPCRALQIHLQLRRWAIGTVQARQSLLETTMQPPRLPTDLAQTFTAAHLSTVGVQKRPELPIRTACQVLQTLHRSRTHKQGGVSVPPSSCTDRYPSR